ncbi:MAG TPA: hypothetical protein VE462_16455 [Propionibacteriaceae bacterium]|nr:hypothetical protein [Propionibacteriaceae bacterium]
MPFCTGILLGYNRHARTLLTPQGACEDALMPPIARYGVTYARSLRPK